MTAAGETVSKPMDETLAEPVEGLALSPHLEPLLYAMEIDPQSPSRTVSVNYSPELCQLFGDPPDASRDLMPWFCNRIHPEDLARVRAECSRFYSDSNQTEFSCQYRVLARNESWVRILDFSQKVESPTGLFVRIIGAIVDLTYWYDFERLYELQSVVLEAVARGESTRETIIRLIHLAEKFRPGLYASYLHYNDRDSTLSSMIAPSISPDYLQIAHQGIGIGEGVGSCGTAAHRRETVIVSDIESDPLWKDYKDYALDAGLRSCWSSPVIGDADRLYGTFAIYGRGPWAPNEQELSLLTTISRLAAIAIDRARGEYERVELIQSLTWTAIPWARLDADLRISDCNPRTLQILECRREDLIGKMLVDLLAPSARPAAEFVLREIVDGELNKSLDTKLDGQQFPDLEFRLNIAAIRNLEGRLLGMTVVFEDVSERKSLENQLRHSQKMEAVGTLAGGVAHDFNNLLTVIGGNLRLLGMRTELSEECREYMHEAELAIEQATTLTRQLLAFSRRQLSTPRPVILDDLIREHLPIIRRSLRDDILLDLRLNSTQASILADAGQLCQVLINLTVNARDAMPSGGVLVIETSAVSAADFEQIMDRPGLGDQGAMLRVTDTGHGIPDETLPRIFEPFFSTKGLDGTGLGLSVVHGIVTGLGGKIEVDSGSDEGTSFRIYFPQSVRPSFSRIDPKQPIPPSKITSILVLEDSEPVRRMMVESIRRHGFPVLSAANGLEVQDLPEDQLSQVGMLVTDVLMPHMNGVEAWKMLKSRKNDLKTLFVSGCPDTSLVTAIKSDESVRFLPKPFTPQDLIQNIRELLGTPLTVG